MPLNVGLRCDAWPAIGVGHLVRCLALADELRARGAGVVLVGRVEGIAWLDDELARRDLVVLPVPADPAGLARLAVAEQLAAVVLDGYHLDPASGAVLRAAGVTVLALVDGTFGDGQDADLYLDQNLDAETLSPHAQDDPPQLLGLDYVLFRDDVVAHRRRCVPTPSSPPRVLVVFGGTDPFGGVEVVVPLLLGTGRPVAVLAVCPDPALRERLEAVPRQPAQSVVPLAPTPDLASVAVSCDAVVTAAGSSVWEFLCLGVPIGVAMVAANQELGYRAVVGRGLALGVGTLDRICVAGPERDRAELALTELLTDAGGRAERADRGQRLVDGLGRSRVADRLLALATDH